MSADSHGNKQPSEEEPLGKFLFLDIFLKFTHEKSFQTIPSSASLHRRKVCRPSPANKPTEKQKTCQILHCSHSSPDNSEQMWGGTGTWLWPLCSGAWTSSSWRPPPQPGSTSGARCWGPPPPSPSPPAPSEAGAEPGPSPRPGLREASRSSTIWQENQQWGLRQTPKLLGRVLPALLESHLEVVCQFLFGGGALLLDIQQLPVVVQHDHELVGMTQTQVGQNWCVLQVLSSLLIGQKSLRGEQQVTLTASVSEWGLRSSNYLSKFFLLVHQLLAAGDHLVEGVESVLQPLDGFHVLII